MRTRDRVLRALCITLNVCIIVAWPFVFNWADRLLTSQGR